MIIGLGIIIFIIGCCLSTYEDTSYNNQRNTEARHRELMRQLEECRQERDLAPREERRARRRIAKDKDGNILAEEITEEIVR